MQAQRTLVSFIGLGSHTMADPLYAYINEHPQACIPSEQTNFFADAKNYAQGIARYESAFRPGKKGSVCGELAMSYLYSSQTAALIARSYPSAKLLAVIEDPLLCVRIEYVEAIASGVMSERVSLAQFIKNNPEVLLRAKFGRQLANYFSYYSGNDLLVLMASEVRDEPLSALRRVFAHIGLDASFVPISLRHLVIEEEDDGKKRPGLIRRLGKKIKQVVTFIYTRLRSTLVAQQVPKVTRQELAEKVIMSPELDEYLRNYYHEDVLQLSALLHEDYNKKWSI